MTAYELLAEPIRKYIRDKGWSQLRPIQAVAIDKILNTENNYIISARTASGKTEAAFLPILTKVDFREEGVQILYISPLIALINDQFKRIDELCVHLDIPVTKWHGEASKSAKNKLIKNPNGILLITPESIEAMFCNRPYEIPLLFSNLKFVVIDEIHSFLGTNRGIQLNSLLYRIQLSCKNKIRVISLSATIGEYDEIKKIGGNPEHTKVLLDTTPRENQISFKYYESEGVELSLDLVKHLFLNVRNNKTLIFPNSRGKTEEVVHKLKRLTQKIGGHTNYFAHHSSINKEIREFVENFAKETTYENFSIACTSTLELGIDIGSVDKVVQIDSTFSVSSLVQRIGRSGRKEGQKSNVTVYSTDDWSLLQSIAIWELYQKGFIDNLYFNQTPFDIALHQILSVIKSHSGITRKDLIEQFKSNYSFSNISANQFDEIINHLTEIDLLENVEGEYIIGLTGERLVNNKEFYSVFITEKLIPVINKGNLIGELKLTPQIREGENILLASKVWNIIEIDLKNKKIYVDKAKDGKKPIFEGGGGDIAKEIRFEMLNLLTSDKLPEYLDDESVNKFKDLRHRFDNIEILDIEFDRPFILGNEKITFYTFNSTKVNRTIELLLKYYKESQELIYNYDEHISSFEISLPIEEITQLLKELPTLIENIDDYLKKLIDENPMFLDFSKWIKYLPSQLQIITLKNVRYDFEETMSFLQNLNIKT